MKIPFRICCFLLLFAQIMSAQIIDRSHTLGFHTTPRLVKPLSNGYWLATGIGNALFPEDTRESVYFLTFTQEQQLLTLAHIAYAYGESYAITDVVPLTDATFVVAYNAGGCDSGGHDYYLEKYDTQANVVWTLAGNLDSAATLPPQQWRLTPDSNLIGFDYNRVWKVDAATGQVLWKGEVIDLNLQEPIFNFELLPGTEDLFSLQGSGFHTWKNISVSTDHYYVLQNSLPLDGYNLKGLGWAENGWYYLLNTITGQLQRINASLDVESLNAGNLEGLIQMTSSHDGLYFLGRQGGQNWLRKTDFTGQNPVGLPMPDRWLSGYSVAAMGDSVAVIGIDGSGPKSHPGNPDYKEFQGQQLWVRTFQGPNPASSPDTMDVAVTGVRQRSFVDTVSQYGAFGFQYYDLQGGDFQVQISNRSNRVLHQVYVNFSYEEDQTHICYFTPTKRVYYGNLSLLPGDSIWVDFGDLSVKNQSGLANEFCFWTVGPNFFPDTRHENDFFCQPAKYAPYYATSTITLLPNPTRDYFRVVNLNYQEDLEWRLFDAIGRLIETGLYTHNQIEIEVPTPYLPNGFYFFRIKDYIGKLIIKH